MVLYSERRKNKSILLPFLKPTAEFLNREEVLYESSIVFHPTARKQLRNAPELFFVIAVSSLLFHEFDSAVLGAPLGSPIVGDWLMGSFADRGQAILRDALSHESGHDGLRPFLRERIVD